MKVVLRDQLQSQAPTPQDPYRVLLRIRLINRYCGFCMRQLYYCEDANPRRQWIRLVSNVEPILGREVPTGFAGNWIILNQLPRVISPELGSQRIERPTMDRLPL